MSDNPSKRRRDISISTQDLSNVEGSQISDVRDPTHGASPSQIEEHLRFSNQTYENRPRSSALAESSMIGQPNSEGKMLLLPLPKRIVSTTSRVYEKNRTTHACDLCRKAKAKCTGGKPCQKCKNESKECVYGDGKRDKERKNLERTTRLNEALHAHAEALRSTLREVVQRRTHTEVDQSRISELIDKSPPTFSDDDEEYTSVASRRQSFYLQQQAGENEAARNVGSNGSLDTIAVDTNRDEESRATGFLGKSSSVRWIQRAEAEVNDGSDSNRTKNNSALYHTGDPDLCGPVDQGNHHASWKYELPPLEAATKLVDSYFVHIHPDFPILSKDDFMQKFQHYAENRVRIPSESDHMALCQINCVLAISSTFANLVSCRSGDVDHRDHLLYYARTRALGLEQQPAGALTSLDYVCSLGLLGLYLVSNYFVNRAWNTVGLAVRNAVTLGLHIRSEAPGLSDIEKELRNRTWWALFSLEHLMNEITGRPSSISYSDIGAPHQIRVDEHERHTGPSSEQPKAKRRKSDDGKGKGKTTESQVQREIGGMSNLVHTPLFTAITTTTYFSHRIALLVLTHEILNRLFCAATVKTKWNEVQDIIRDIDARLQKWKSSLPDGLKFPATRSEGEDEHENQRKGLAIVYHTARMILHRPALCRMDGRIRNESSLSQKFNHDAVTLCIDSARAVIATLRRPADPSKFYLIKPWWEILHHLCQAAGILMLEIAFCACHIPEEASEILRDAKDAVNWLRAMSRQSIPARKAWQTYDRTLRLVATKIDADMSDMLTEAEMPPGWGPAPSLDHSTSFNEQEMAGLDIFSQSLAGQQSQRLAATTAWVQGGHLQSTAAPPPETNQSFDVPNEFFGQPDFFQAAFQQNLVDPYTSFDNPGFPWYDSGPNFFADQEQEMQITNTNADIGTYQPYGTGLVPAGASVGVQNQEGAAHSSQSQNDALTRNVEQGYQNIENPYGPGGPYDRRWRQGHGDGG